MVSINLFGSKKTGADAAMPYYDRAQSTVRRYAQPYISQGQQFADPLAEKYSAMFDDPAAFLEQLMQGYTQSDAYKMKLDEATKAAGATAAAGGYRGTPQDIQAQGRLAEMLQGEDMQQWLGNILGIQQTGLGGGQHFYDIGYGASSGAGSDIANLLQSQGSLAFQGQQEKNKRDQDIMKALIQGASSMYGSTF